MSKPHSTQDTRTCANGPDEYGDWPCDPKGYFGVAECQTCGWIGAWDRSLLGPPPQRFVGEEEKGHV